MGLKSRRKGVRGELEACEVLRPLFPNVRRKAMQARGGHEGADLENTPGFHVEVGIGNVNPATKHAQLCHDLAPVARFAGCDVPIALTRRDRGPWLATLHADDLIEFVRLAERERARAAQSFERTVNADLYINDPNAAPDVTPDRLEPFECPPDAKPKMNAANTKETA